MPSTFTKPLSDGDAESIQAFYGFYGNPIYRCKSFMDMTKVVTLTKTDFFRPYGFGSWGFGSSGFGYNQMVLGPNAHYGGYHFAG